MTSPSSLSPKQAKILAFIESEISKSGRPPTYRDIADHCGYDAVGTVQDHIRSLIRKGYLEKTPGVARGIRIAHHTQSLFIPILGMVPAGRPIEAIESQLGTLSIPARWKGELYALKVKGESMKDAGILDGDFVVVKKQTTAENGEIVVALMNGEATVKYLEKKAGRIRLLPANSKFSPIEWQEGLENLIQGKVVGVQRFF